VLLEVAGRALAVVAADVEEVARLGTVTPLAGTASWVLGVAAVRGAILLVVDLSRMVGRAAAETDPRPQPPGGERLVVIGRGPWRAGLVGVVVRGIAEGCPVAGPTERPAADGGAGLPLRGAVRPESGSAPDGGEEPVPLLDVAALLHALHDDAPAPAPDPP
jgi:chemotaxis signal transduction protein